MREAAWLVREEMWKVIRRMVLLLPWYRRHNAPLALRNGRECRTGREANAQIVVMEMGFLAAETL